MPLTESEIQLFNDTLDLCVADPQFLERFYRTFVGHSPEIARLFAQTDMRRQHRALKASLYTTMLAADQNAAAISHLQALGERHRELGVADRDYDTWLECILAAVEATVEGYDEEIESVWRRVLAVGIAVLRDGRMPDSDLRIV